MTHRAGVWRTRGRVCHDRQLALGRHVKGPSAHGDKAIDVRARGKLR